MNSAVCVRILSKSLCLHQLTPDMLMPHLCLNSWHFDTGLEYNSKVSVFLNGNASAKGTWVEPGIADVQVYVDSLVILILVRAGSPPTGQCLCDTPDILLFSILNLVDINLEMKLNWECRHSTKLLIFLLSCLYYINNGHVHFIVQRNH